MVEYLYWISNFCLIISNDIFCNLKLQCIKLFFFLKKIKLYRMLKSWLVDKKSSTFNITFDKNTIVIKQHFVNDLSKDSVVNNAVTVRLTLRFNYPSLWMKWRLRSIKRSAGFKEVGYLGNGVRSNDMYIE